ncbi:C39 family peptidase [Thermophilibacter sp.]
MDDQFDGMHLMDLNGDGIPDAVDTNGDGVADAFDTNGDGFFESLDTNNDGMADKFDLDGDREIDALDTNNDGVADAFDTNGDGTLDSWDIDGDGVADAWDTNGDGIPDQFDTDGDGAIDAVDTDGDGIPDSYADGTPPEADQAATSSLDLNGDGVPDRLIDTDGDGVADAVDLNGDGVADAELTYLDVNGDGTADGYAYGIDLDGDGRFDYVYEGYDLNGDGAIDQGYVRVDANGDGTFEADEVYDADDWAAQFDVSADEVPSIDDGEVPGAHYEHFDPSQTDTDKVVGNPAADADDWEYQEASGPCAIYAQVMAYENMTGQDVDINEVIAKAEEMGIYEPGSGTSMEDMDEVLKMLGAQTEEGTGGTLDDLRECLENGGRIVVGVDGDEIWSGDNDNDYIPNNPNHAIEVTGIDYSGEEPMVIVNDSGTPDGHAIQVPASDFMDAWEDSDYAYVEAYA